VSYAVVFVFRRFIDLSSLHSSAFNHRRRPIIFSGNFSPLDSTYASCHDQNDQNDHQLDPNIPETILVRDHAFKLLSVLGVEMTRRSLSGLQLGYPICSWRRHILLAHESIISLVHVSDQRTSSPSDFVCGEAAFNAAIIKSVKVVLMRAAVRTRLENF
jgi:hypothetical protein